MTTPPPTPDRPARAPARIGLLGNPGDLYGGLGLGLAFDAFGATCRVTSGGAGVDLQPDRNPLAALHGAAWEVFRRHARACGEVGLHGSRLVTPDGDDDPCRLADVDGLPPAAVLPLAVDGTCDVPRQSGLSGSSAILVACLRALADHAGLALPPHRLAWLAWRAEQELLGIRAGPLDRLVQAHGGLVAMDWSDPWQPWSTRRLPAASLPALVLSWQTTPGEPSGAVHADVFGRWRRGDPLAREVVGRLHALGARGVAALRAGDSDALVGLMAENVTQRRRLYTLGAGDEAMLATGARHGAGSKLAGSGGAVVHALPRGHDTAPLVAALRAEGFGALVPRVTGPDAPLGLRLRAVLLAAGFATRMYPLTRDVAKPLLEVGGLPMLTRMVRQLHATGCVGDVVVVHNGRFADAFARWRDALPESLAPWGDADAAPGRGDLRVRLVDNGVTEDRHLRGALADLSLALEHSPDDGPDGYLVAAGDNLLDLPLDPLVRAYAERRRPQLLVRRLPEPVPPRRYNEVVLGDDGRVRSFREKPDAPTSPLAALAVYALPADLPAVLAGYLARPDAERDAPGHLLAWWCDRAAVDGLHVGGRWFDVGDLTRLEAARAWCREVDG